MELLAALAGSFFLYKTNAAKISKQLVGFLWITFIVEVIAAYAPIAYFSDYKYFSFVKDTVFEDHKWLYNMYSLFSAVFLTYYFHQHLRNIKWKLILQVTLIAFSVAAIINLIFSGVFFVSDAQFTLLIGTLILIMSIIMFYFELLQSDLLLQLKRILPMYISVGVMVFSLCVTPVDIFSEYFSEGNDSFVVLRNNVYLYTNIFMYTTFIIGFIICSKEKTSY
ncbi:MAG: hypothetical protein KJO05_05825 [Bacteroidia bacterium]|nr:hypothetical protein [Bacteroidia bacterium]MBT8275864.1 hypothetical protein [Bacteroidia bacterium]NNF31238.1 hypothetical protein [Flavobacteriaceae bacterium]NNK54567.1 hypothetical protein [Flavobacteriaceae bacterium]NNM09364.1 hypothetical protein [Flavobacteriaceae bacterium]